jgi:hypothetical protein
MRTTEPPAARQALGYPGDDSDSPPTASDDRTGLATQIAADLLPEVGDSGAVEAEQGL